MNFLLGDWERADFLLTAGEPADVAVMRLSDPEGTPAGAVARRGGHLELAVTAGKVTFYLLPLDAYGANRVLDPQPS